MPTRGAALRRAEEPVESFGKQFLLSFLPLLVAIDVIGTLPILMGLLEPSTRSERRRIIDIALFTALALGFAFLFVGKAVLRFLDVEVEHFAIAGGLVLFGLAVQDILGRSVEQPPERQEMLAVVPIGTPLTAGPATLTALLLLGDKFSVGAVALAFIGNIALAWVTFSFANAVVGFLGQGGLRAMSKIAHLLLAAIAVRLVVEGIQKAFNIA